MANLFGTNPNQVPLNSMLGNLAFQDKAYVSIDRIGIGTTATDTGTSGQIVQAYGGAYVSGSVGIGTTNPTSTLQVIGDARVGINTSQGIILTSPNGTRYRLIVDNSGVISTVLAP